MLAYLRHPKDSTTGDALVPDNEYLKGAITHFVLYRHFLRKNMVGGTQNDANMMNFHLQQWETLKMKATGKLNTPDTATLESIKSYRDRLVPKEHMYSGMFSKLSNYESHPKTTYLGNIRR